MHSVRKPRWQQATALVSLSTCGAMTGIAFAHGTTADMTSPTRLPAHLLSFKKAGASSSPSETALRSAIVNAANYYLRLAQGRTPAEMEALIWQNDSLDGADHGESCAAFASLTLQSGAQAAGQESWVTGGTSYPWPVHDWVDARVDPNPDSPGIVSIVQDAQAHDRWHPLGDGYNPKPGDWVLFGGHVEVVTKYSGGVLYTIGGDSLPNFSVNAHQYDGPLNAQGVAGFVNNGQLLASVSSSAGTGHSQPSQDADEVQVEVQAPQGQPAIPGLVAPAFALSTGSQGAPSLRQQASAPGAQAILARAAAIPGSAPITGIFTSGWSQPPSPRYSRSQPPPAIAAAVGAIGTPGQQAFIGQIAAGAVAAQQKYGVPASVTIAQAIDESGWGQSQLAAQDNNLFGIKGTGPAGSVMLPTQEFENGEWVTITAPFRVYNNVAESIEDHAVLLATSSSYQQAMADRQSPDAFANDLTGVYATDPDYGSSLIAIMRTYNLYRYDSATQAAPSAATHGAAGQNSAGQNAAGQNLAGQKSAARGAGPTAAAVPATAGQRTGARGTTVAGTVVSGAKVPGLIALSASATGPAVPGTAGQGAAVRVGGGDGAARPGWPATATAGGSARTARRGSGTATLPGTGTATLPGTGTAARRGPGTATLPGTGTAARRGSGTATLPGTGTAARRGSGTATLPGTGTAARRGSGTATLPGTGTATLGGYGTGAPGGSSPDGASIPGLVSAYRQQPVMNPRPANGLSRQVAGADRGAAVKAGPRNAPISTKRYVSQMPAAVTTAFVTTAKTSLLRAKPLYQDVASGTGIRWELLAACDWMQCQAEPRRSPAHGEKLGTRNTDGTIYRTKSEALAQCSLDLVELAGAVYGIDLAGTIFLSVRELANVFAAFRWGGLLTAHNISAMEFPYSVAGLTGQHMKMRWPDIREPHAPDKPGTRFRMSFGAVPVVLGLDYPAVA